jgi:hypothetical protein
MTHYPQRKHGSQSYTNSKGNITHNKYNTKSKEQQYLNIVSFVKIEVWFWYRRILVYVCLSTSMKMKFE